MVQIGGSKINSAVIISGIMTKGQVNGGQVYQGKMTGANITGAVLRNANINEVLSKVGNGPSSGILNKVPIIGNFLQKLNPFK